MTAYCMFLDEVSPIYGFIMLLLQMQKDLVIYEMNVRAFTMDESSGLDNNIRGSYLGVIEKVTSLLSLGIQLNKVYRCLVVACHLQL